MKKSNIFYFIALTVSLIAYSADIFSYLSTRNVLTISNASNNQLVVYFIVMIATMPLFVLSIWQMIRSVKSTQEVSTAAIVLLMVNLIFMFGLISYALISNLRDIYAQYTDIINSEYTSAEVLSTIKVQRTNLIYTTISAFVTHLTYLITSILAFVFKLEKQ